MPFSSRPEVESTVSLKKALDISLQANLLLKTSTLLLESVMTLAEANRAYSQKFILRSSDYLQSFYNVRVSSRRVEIPELVELVKLGRQVVKSLTESSVSLSKLSGQKRITCWSSENTHNNSLEELDTGFREIFARLSFIEANLHPKHFDDIKKAVELVRDQHVLNSKVTLETLGALDNMLGRSILLLRSLESILDNVR